MWELASRPVEEIWLVTWGCHPHVSPFSRALPKGGKKKKSLAYKSEAKLPLAEVLVSFPSKLVAFREWI